MFILISNVSWGFVFVMKKQVYFVKKSDTSSDNIFQL